MSSFVLLWFVLGFNWAHSLQEGLLAEEMALKVLNHGPQFPAVLGSEFAFGQVISLLWAPHAFSVEWASAEESQGSLWHSGHGSARRHSLPPPFHPFMWTLIDIGGEFISFSFRPSAPEVKNFFTVGTQEMLELKNVKLQPPV